MGVISGPDGTTHSGCAFKVLLASPVNIWFRFFLTVDPPRITRSPESQSVSTGADISFSVEATGDDLHFQWQRDGVDIVSNDSRFHYNYTRRTSTLQIHRVQKSDKGHYRCLVKNPVKKSGVLSKEAELAVGKFCSFVDSALFNTTYVCTVLSWATTHGHSQLKHQKLWVGSCTEEMLKLLNYIPAQGPTPNAKGTKSTCLITLFVLCRGQPDSGESFKANWLVPRCQVFEAFSHRLQYTNFVLQGKNAANREERFDAWYHGAQSASEQSQLCELSGPTVVGSYTEDLKNHKTVKTGGWVLARDNMLRSSLTIYMYLCIQLQPHFLAFQLQTCLNVNTK